MKKISGIYCLIHKESLKCYIGQSINIDFRKKKYKYISCDGQPYIYRALKKYGFNAFDFEIIEECAQEDLNSREIFWIKFYDSLNNGYNCREGGIQGKMSEESKSKMSVTRRAKIKNGLSEEEKKNILAGLEKLKQHFGHKFQLMAPDGTIIEGFNLSQFARDNNLSQSHLYGVITGKRISHRGYKAINPIKSKRKKSVKQLNLKTGEVIKTWESAWLAALSINGKGKNFIGDVCQGKFKHAYGFGWTWADDC